MTELFIDNKSFFFFFFYFLLNDPLLQSRMMTEHQYQVASQTKAPKVSKGKTRKMISHLHPLQPQGSQRQARRMRRGCAQEEGSLRFLTPPCLRLSKLRLLWTPNSSPCPMRWLYLCASQVNLKVGLGVPFKFDCYPISLMISVA